MAPVGAAADGTVSQAEANRPTEALTATNILRERPDGPGRKLKAPSSPTCARTQCFPGSRKRASASCTVSLARSCTVSEQVAQMRSQPEGCMASQLSPQGLGKEMRRSLIGTIVFAPPTSAMGHEPDLDHGFPTGPGLTKDYQRHDIEKGPGSLRGPCLSSLLKAQDGPFMSMICGAGSGAAGRGAGVGAGASRRPCRTRPWK